MNIDIIMPVYNEENCLEETVKRLLKLQESQNNNLNFIFVLDGCTDKSFEILNEYAKNNDKFKIIVLSKNYGQQNAFLAGYRESNKREVDYVLTLDVDLQDPPELLNEMLDVAIKKDADIVLGKKKKSKCGDFLADTTSYLFYRIINLFLCEKMIEDVADFRLVKKNVVDALSSIRQTNFSLRALVGNYGFKTEVIEYDRCERKFGISHYTYTNRLKLGIDTLYSRKNKLDVFILVLTFIPLLMSLYAYIFYSIVSSFILFGIFIQSIILCIIAQSVLRIFDELRGAPQYTIKEKINL